jgi:hypothetical protein
MKSHLMNVQLLYLNLQFGLWVLRSTARSEISNAFTPLVFTNFFSVLNGQSSEVQDTELAHK